MNSFVTFPIVSLIFITLLLIVFSIKPKLNFVENKIYKALLITNIIGLVFEILCHFAVNMVESQYILSMFILKTYIIYLFVWTLIFNIYVFYVTYKKKDKEKYFKKLTNITILISFLFAIAVYISQLHVFNENNVTYSYGISVDFFIGICTIIGTTWVIKCLIDLKIIKQKKYIPILSCIVVLLLIVAIQANNRGILIATTGHSFICLLMFFTLENPDLKMLHEMELAKIQAEKANAAKSDFLSSMSHEVRTPLNAIMGFSQLGEDVDDVDEAKEYFENITKASISLLEIVNSVLDISKIESGNMEIVNKFYRTSELFNDIELLVSNRALAKGLDLKIYIAPDIPMFLYGDASNVKKIILNLLTNAIKYTKEGYVSLTVNSVLKNNVCRLIISVEDSGRGIEAEDVDKLFKKFSRLEEDKNTSIEGTGLGLAITKHLTNLMGGDTTLVKTEYGKGSKFTATINQGLKDMSVDSEVTDKIESKDKIDLSGKKILIVDDNKINIKVTTKYLERYKCEAFSALSGQECLDLINSGNKYDLILLDQMMPNLNGVETLHKLRENKEFNIPVVIYTADEIAGKRESYMDEGFDDFLGKPIIKEEFEKLMTKFFVK